jgi:hypothetical protein
MLESHPSLIRPWSVITPSKSSKSRKEANPWSMEALAKILLVAITRLECWYLELFSFSPHHGWTPSFSVPRPYDAVTSLCYLLPQPCSCCWDLTGWPLSSSVLPPPDTSAGLDDRCSPTAAIKGKPFTQNHRYQSLISIRARHHHPSCSFPS